MTLTIDNRQAMRIIAPLLTLPGAPEAAAAVAALVPVLRKRNVSARELEQAVMRAMEREEFYPPPAKVLSHCMGVQLDLRKEADRRRQQQSFEAAAQRRALPAAEDDSTDAIPEGYPWRAGPEIDPRPIADSSRRQSPVLDADGNPDPYWPELPGREPAWRRKLLYDAGLWTWERASALTAADARKHPSTMDDSPRGGGPRRLL